MKTVADFRRWAEGYQGQQGGSGEALPLPSGQHTSEEVAAADLPALDAAQAQLQTQPERSMWERFAGGDGDFSFADGMVGAGAALMARDNPSGAAALASALRYSKDGKTKQTANRSVVRTDPKTGQVTVYDPATNTFKTQQVFEREPEDPKEPTRVNFQKNLEAGHMAYEAAEKMASYRDMIAKGQIDVSILSQAEKSFDELTDKPMTDAQRNAVRMALDIRRMQLAEQVKQKGVQTEGDFKRIEEATTPKIGRFNNEAMMEALDVSAKSFAKAYDYHVNFNEPVYRKFGSRVAYEQYEPEVKTRREKLAEYEKNFGPLREEFLKTRRSSQDQASQVIDGRTPKQGKDPLEGQTATNRQTGEKMIRRNGKWEPL